MNLSAPFIRRPVGTTLLTLAIALVGITAFALLPVAPLPQVDFPTIRVQASLPGASPETMAATVATPLERMLGRIAGITEMTSQSSQGSTSIAVQFDLSRDIDGAARDVQAAINAARAVLPVMPNNPTYRKVNPADMPIMVMGLTSDSLTQGELYDFASSVLSQKLSQVYGVGQVTMGGSSSPAVRVDLEPGFLNSRGISLEEVRTALSRSNANMPKGMLDNGETQWFVTADDKLFEAKDFAPLIIRYIDGKALRLSDITRVHDGVEDIRNVGYANGRPAVLLMIFKQPGANVIDTVKRVRATLPTLRAWMPESANYEIIMDRSPSITESLREVEQTLVIAMLLVILVVFLFLRNARATWIPAVAVPVSLLGTFGIMYLSDFSLNHLSLMALTIATGFVVDDAIVVTENIVRHVEDGAPPMQAAFQGSREVAFTVMSISLSLVAIFIPILGMGGMEGRLFKEFAVTLSTAVLVSLVISLTATPMMCARLLKGEQEARETRPRKYPFMGGLVGVISRGYARIMRLWGDFLDELHESYARTLAVALRHRRLTLFSLLLTIAFTVYLYIIIPKGFFPQQDTGQIFGMIRADQSISFQAMQPKVATLMEVVGKHPAVASVGGFSGGRQSNSGMVFVTLKPPSERPGTTTDSVINELRGQLAHIPGVDLIMQGMQDLRAGGRQTRATYQYTLQSDDLALLRSWSPRIAEAFRDIPGMVDVDSDQETRGLQTTVVVDRDHLARLGGTQKQVDTALSLAFGQSFASTIYKGSNQYRVVMEFDEPYLQSPESLLHLYVPTRGDDTRAELLASSLPGLGTGVSGNAASSISTAVPSGPLAPLNAFSTFVPTLTALSVSHQGQFTATTISFNLLPGYSLSQMEEAIEEALFKLGVPDELHGAFQGTASAFARTMSSQLWLIAGALVVLYIVLGVLYESLIHPLTILSTLPSAGVGALLGLLLFGSEFTVIAFIGVLLLSGIVKKNAIMMIDFALEARRHEGLSAEAAIYKACLLRFRPIMMTTMAAVLGAVPLLLGQGNGAEMRTPLGITIVGGLLVSQLLTLYTTPVVYLFLDRFSRDTFAERAVPGRSVAQLNPATLLP